GARVEHLEREQVLDALDATKWNVVRAATRLGITRAMLRHRIAKYGLAAPSRRGRRRGSFRPKESVAAAPAPPRWESRRIVLLAATLRGIDDATSGELARHGEIVA